MIHILHYYLYFSFQNFRVFVFQKSLFYLQLSHIFFTVSHSEICTKMHKLSIIYKQVKAYTGGLKHHKTKKAK